MIDPKELRLGNKFILPNGEIGTITYHEIRLLIVAQDKPNYTPIPLTPEWLERLGFNVSDNGRVYDHPAPAVPEDEHKDLGKRYPSFFFNNRPEVAKWMDCHTRVTVEYVHQLQNLYFALTGEELTLKDKP